MTLTHAMKGLRGALVVVLAAVPVECAATASLSNCVRARTPPQSMFTIVLSTVWTARRPPDRPTVDSRSWRRNCAKSVTYTQYTTLYCHPASWAGLTYFR